MPSPRESTRRVGATILRTPSHEAADRDEFVRNMTTAAYKDWPNKAGFDGLTEERGPIQLTIRGNIPAWAAGSLYRTGPGACKVEGTPRGTEYVSHWFDGFAHTHRFDILPPEEGTDGPARVLYSSRRQAERLVEDIRARGMGSHYSFGQRRDPCLGLFSKFMSVFRRSPPDLHNVSVMVDTNWPGFPARTRAIKEEAKVTTGGHRSGIQNVWLTTDAAQLVEIDSDTLEPIGAARQTALHPDLKGPLSSAHAQRDHETGDAYNFNLELGKTSTYRIFRVNAATGTTDILATVSDLVRPSYIHSFFLTPSFVVLCIPVSHYVLNGLTMPWERNIMSSIEEFDETKPCKWLVVDRRGNNGLVAVFETPAGFFFHSVNSFEEATEDGTEVFCDFMEYPNQDILKTFYYDVLLDRDGATGAFWNEKNRIQTIQSRLARYRFRIPSPKSGGGPGGPHKGRGVLVWAIPSPHAGELPVVNPAYHCRRYRYVYSAANRGRSTLLDSIVKTDTVTREALIWSGPRGHTPGEPIFVARPAKGGDEEVAEDDGVLLSVVLDGSAQRSYLLCLDAKTLEELGRAECSFAVPFGFHGVHAPGSM
ncbi:beta,beta-carotene 9',10'-dioxygenase [Sodiomyces alkalinus F11]|uniref:Beta,beta-carotene 9',10'-dioxygenase n=1 Tax=Sodiomyces alkalinus (strain CBS 110278 / VKM F-3762 / F11) TaxID=1314773 RepID=A0A3N2PQ03_SODAK|nr:beta,beta-carotene 9',10'-dioxygenase [Sodiomyces alkalinus F11]ROT36534.1 beta,beta-carotene 9',10'-dioxygenase [Sodiomyces alkalinus F11]